MEYIAFDSHKRYTLASVEAEQGGTSRETRIPHERGALKSFLERRERGSPVAVETIGNWYWIVDEIEAAGMVPRLVHARKAKLMMGMINKTDKLDAQGMNRLQRTGALPTVWIPSGELRDRRDLARTRMVLVRQRTQLKNRIHATLAKYALTVDGASDIFGVKGRDLLRQRMKELPPQTQFMAERLLESVEHLDAQVGKVRERMEAVFESTEEVKRLMTLPGVGFLLAVTIAQEVGDIERFGSGPTWRLPTSSACTGIAGPIATWPNCTSGSSERRATRKRSGRWAGTSRRRPTGSSRRRKITWIPNPKPNRLGRRKRRAVMCPQRHDK
jgi:transposase